jgi:NTP pyrophosphatase (non-canonical NTP hydrolase)
MKEITQKLREFTAERDWDQFHSPKNLIMALSVEVAEIVEHFQWLTEEESYNLDSNKLEKIKEEIGDVIIYLVMLADKLGVDPIQAAKEKIEKNRKNYPEKIAIGKANKYKEL